MEPIRVPPQVWQRPDMLEALRKRDVGQVFRLVQQFTGASQTQLGSACDLTQGAVSRYMSGKAQVETLDKFEDIADGLGMSDKARMTLGIAPRDLHIPQQRTATADESGLGSPTDTQVTSDSEGLLIPCRASDGRVIWVSIPRRTFLLGGVAAAAAGAPIRSGPAQPMSRLALKSAGEPSPLEHLERMRLALVEADNLLGPRHVIPAVHEHVSVIQQLRSAATGADRKALQRLQAQYAEFAGWLHHDAGDFSAARSWTDRALTWSQSVADSQMTAYIYARKSQLAGDMRDATSTIDYAEAAMDLAMPGSRLRAAAAAYAARGYAIAGGHDATLRMLDIAHATLAELDADPDSPWAVWMNEAFLETERARCLALLGRHGDAAEIFHGAIDDLPDGFHRDRGVYLAREALAHAGSGHAEQAATTGTAALSVAINTDSGRIINELAHLDMELAQWARVPEVAEFREHLTSVLPQQKD